MRRAPAHGDPPSVPVAGRKCPRERENAHAIPKEKIGACMHQLADLNVQPPVHMGEVVCPDVCGNRRGRDRHQDRGVIFNQRNESGARPTGRAL